MKPRSIFIFGLLTLLFALTGYTMIHFSSKEPLSPHYPPEKYQKEWEKADSLVEQGLPQSALEIVKGIYDRAKSSHNSPQFIKAILYQMSLRSDYQEDFMENIIADTKAEIDQAIFPVRQILYSIQAELYWSYYEMNRHLILDRSTAAGFQQEDIRTWDLQAFISKVIESYQKSLEEEGNLRKIPLKDFDDILEVEKDSKKYRPTLYDFLAHRTVDFFMNAESGLTEPVYRFSINSANFFSPANKFALIDISTRDTFSLHFHAIRLLQDLIGFHLSDNDPAALIDVDLKRLDFVRQEAEMDLKDSHYRQALQALAETYQNHPSSAEINFKLAYSFYESGMNFNPLKPDEYQWDLKKAHALCQEVMKNFPDSEGAESCRSLIGKIQEKQLSLTTDYTSPDECPFLGLLRYKNVKTVYLRILQMDPEKDKELREFNRDESLLIQYLQQPVFREWNLTLPDDGDFQPHSVEISLPELPLGYYVILLSSNEQFSFKSDPVSHTALWISNISYISRESDNGGHDVYVLHREKGSPMSGVKVTAFSRDYNYQHRKYRLIKYKDFLTDEQGFIQIPAPVKGEKSQSLILDFRKGNDRLITDSYFYQYFRSSKEKEKRPRTFFFTDRAIYRPGQVVYFKGVVIETDGKENNVLREHPSQVVLYDVNHQKIASLDLITNEYGSFHGSFVAPAGVLTGRMTISNESGTVSIQVEEYKRPRFEVVFQPVQGIYKLNEKMTVNGVAKTYAGSGVDQAQVKYRVVRSATFPYPIWWRGWYPTSPEMEIANGVILTGDTGHFAITFQAIPDLSLDETYKPVFHYRIFADVTDINGETQSSSTLVSVGYTAMLLDAAIPPQVDKTGKQSFSISTTNLNGQPEPAKVRVGIFRLKEPGRILRERKWELPDKFILTEREFIETFPFDIYKDEDKKDTWAKEATILEKEYMTPVDSLIHFEKLSSWKSGSYLIILQTTDAFGEKIEVKKYTTVFSPNDKKAPSEMLHWYTILKTTGEPGENARMLIGTAEKNVYVIREVIHEKKTVSREWFRLSDRQQLVEIPIREEFRGNFQVVFAFVRHNRSYQDEQLITVPFTNKELSINFETFRNKLKPGQDEEWHIRIRGKDGDRLAAEMAATLYDASLDAFIPHDWTFSILNPTYGFMGWDIDDAFGTRRSDTHSDAPYFDIIPIIREYDALNWFGFGPYPVFYEMVGDRIMAKTMEMAAMEQPMEDAGMEAEGLAGKGEVPPEFVPEPEPVQAGDIKVRRDLRETAFFYPALMTNEDGDVIIRFTIPEALTRWKMIGLAHTQDLKYGMVTRELVTQKDLMVFPNAPRFFREGDRMVFTAKITSLAEIPLNGLASLEFFDAITMQPVELIMVDELKDKAFHLEAGRSTVVKWPVEIPYTGLQAVTYRVKAMAGGFSDAEEAPLPVLTNRMLVTETLPLPVKGKQTRQFTFGKLLESGSSTTIRNNRLTLEFTSNPAWYAVQALPYLMEYPYECSEQIFSRYYANTLASHIANANPKIKRVFDAWRNYTPDALLSNLEKNQELIAVFLEETPWVLNARNESERKQRIALLFDLVRMTNEQQTALKKLQEMQLPNGGWPWFREMRDNRYITQHIVAGFGHLNHLQVQDMVENDEVWQMIRTAVLYLDDRMAEDYANIKKNFTDKMDEDHLGYTQIHYLYTRSYFNSFNFSIPVEGKNKEALDYFLGQAKKYWLNQNLYMQGMIALALHRYDNATVPQRIIKSLKEKAIVKDEMGMYWRQDAGYFWFQAPIETQALLIEAFDEVANDQKSVEEMKVWLLKQKQTQDWKTTKATVEAVYALLLRGTDLLTSEELVQVTLGGMTVDPRQLEEVKLEAGTGYFKTAWNGQEVTPEMGNITLTKTDDGVAWGAVYWQYFENLDKITPHETPLKLEKKLFIERNTPTGPVIEPVTSDNPLKVGDRVKVRIELRVERDMEYVHMKDMRAAGFEPVNVLSGYRYQGGLGYYESTRDASTNFFIGYISRGTYVFEYELKASQAGEFSNGITTIQCMYAPEFASHSEGIRVVIAD